MGVLIVIIILLLILISCRNVSRMISREQLDVVYEDMKSGDILMVKDEFNKAKNIYVLYKNDDEILVVYKKPGGNYLELKPISHILKIHKKKDEKVIWMSLKGELTDDKKQAFEESLHQFYPRAQEIDVVFTYNMNNRDFLKIHLYTGKILISLGLLKIGSAFPCIGDPMACVTQVYNNSGYIYESDFKDDLVLLF